MDKVIRLINDIGIFIVVRDGRTLRALQSLGLGGSKRLMTYHGERLLRRSWLN